MTLDCNDTIHDSDVNMEDSNNSFIKHGHAMKAFRQSHYCPVKTPPQASNYLMEHNGRMKAFRTTHPMTGASAFNQILHTWEMNRPCQISDMTVESEGLSRAGQWSLLKHIGTIPELRFKINGESSKRRNTFMVTALSWKNVRAFDQWIDSIRMLQHSRDNAPEVMLPFIENMPTPWHYGSSSGNGRVERLCCSETGASSSYQDGNDSIVAADEQQTLKLFERNLELVGTR